MGCRLRVYGNSSMNSPDNDSDDSLFDFPVDAVHDKRRWVSSTGKGSWNLLPN